MLNNPFSSISGLIIRLWIQKRPLNLPCPGRWRAGFFGRSAAGAWHLRDGAAVVSWFFWVSIQSFIWWIYESWWKFPPVFHVMNLYKHGETSMEFYWFPAREKYTHGGIAALQNDQMQVAGFFGIITGQSGNPYQQAIFQGATVWLHSGGSWTGTKKSCGRHIAGLMAQ